MRRGRALSKYAPAPAVWAFLAIQVGIAIGCLVRAPRQSAYGAIVLLVGAIAWLIWRRK
jgi:hypothetical protein